MCCLHVYKPIKTLRFSINIRLHQVFPLLQVSNRSPHTFLFSDPRCELKLNAKIIWCQNHQSGLVFSLYRPIRDLENGSDLTNVGPGLARSCGASIIKLGHQPTQAVSQYKYHELHTFNCRLGVRVRAVKC